MNDDTVVTDLTRDELSALCEELGQPGYRAAQITEWLYRKHVLDFEGMTNLSKDFRALLAGRAVCVGSTVETVQRSPDGTCKWLIRLRDGETVEGVMIPGRSRRTVCISTQVGCATRCAFCASGLHGLKRNLTCGEIVEQILHAAGETDRPTNVVFMGIGEPLANYAQLIRAIHAATAQWGLGLGPRRLTVSTVGIPKKILRLADDAPQVNLAVSLHAADDAARDRLVPLNRRFPIDKVLRAVRQHAAKTGREPTFEYVLIPNVNASAQAAHRLARLLRGMQCTVNLIAYNETKELPWKSPTAAQVDRFRTALTGAGLHVHVRKRMGSDISAACGQLRCESQVMLPRM